MKIRHALCVTVLAHQAICPAWSQALEDFAPVVSLEEFGQSLIGYDSVFIGVTIAREDVWQEELDDLSRAVPVQMVTEDDSMSLDRMVLSLDLRMTDDRGWQIHEEYRLDYRRIDNIGAPEIRRNECISASIKQKARFGFFWSSLPDDEIEHRCLEIGAARIQFPTSIMLVVESTEIGITQPISVGKKALVESVAQKAAASLGLPAVPGLYIVFETSELSTVDSMATDRLSEVCGIFSRGESTTSSDRLNQFISSPETRISVFRRSSPADGCVPEGPRATGTVR